MRVSPRAFGGGLGLLLILGLGLLFGLDPGLLAAIVGSAPSMPPPSMPSAPSSREPAKLEDQQSQFVAVVLADTEEVWSKLFSQEGGTYEPPTLVLFSGMVQSACGFAQAAMGPFYCPLDGKVYIDLSFYSDLQNRMGAPGDFAQAYVIAHEIGHHVQNQLGISAQVRQAQARAPQRAANALSVRQELQADCLAGVWAHHAARMHDLLEEGDIEEGLNAASAIGDDRLQKQSRGYVTPESFTHGSSEQRVTWFRRGLESGSMDSCDTFKRQ